MNYIKRAFRHVSAASANLFVSATQPIPIKRLEYSTLNSVDKYWGEHTVNSRPFETAVESLKYLEWRSEQYPLFQEFMQLYGQHDNEILLDYGCGPGNDLVGFLVHTKAKKVIGIDISAKALNLAAKRLALHKINLQRIELIQITDSTAVLPLDNETIDYIYCEGVLHHLSNPVATLREFHRILKPGSQASIMVYNRNSLWFHLYTAYIKIVLQNAFPGLDIDQIFAKNTDGEECPISKCYVAEDFISICKEAGFQAKFLGGYLALQELNLLHEFGNQAQQDERLANEHRDFLQSLIYDEKGYPLYKGKYAGIGGVYILSK